jgi:cytochrome c biogenesis protein ResB
MGMELTLLQMAWNAQKEIQVTPTQLVEKMQQLPPSAVRINRWDGAPAEETWLLEGEEKTLAFDGKKYVIYYGRKIIELPFIVNLKEFKKTDYPGTAMAKEYESHVQVVRGMNMMSAPIKISMNEPLQEAGYTLYQASFQEVSAGKFASILSVNLDPGRWFKYFGGIILAIGIITYTLSKSRRFKAYFN